MNALVADFDFAVVVYDRAVGMGWSGLVWPQGRSQAFL